MTDIEGDIRDIFDERGIVLYSGRNTVKRMMLTTSEGETDVVVKRFACRNWLQRLTYGMFMKSKARKAYENAMKLEVLGIGTPHPYSYMDFRKRGLMVECYYVSGVDQGHDLAEMLPVHGENKYSTETAEAFGRFVAELHKKGIIHKDLNSTNVRYHKSDSGETTFTLIDINRMEFWSEDIPQDVRLDNLTRFTGRLDITEHVAKAYALAMGEDVDDTVIRAREHKLLHDINWKRRKALTHPVRTIKSMKEYNKNVSGR